MNMQATDFEFRRRFFVIGMVFWLGFSLYSFDHVNAGVAFANGIAPHIALARHLIIRLIFAFAALLTFSAAAIRTWASAYLHSHIVHDTELHAENLVADGPYRFVRNPLYLGTILLAFGMGLMANREGFFVIVIGMILIAYRLIFREEAQLLASQGESYRRYLQTVPRLIPSLAPLVPASGAQPRWPQAFFGETFLWAFAAASIGFAVTMKMKFWYIPLAAALPLYFLSIVFFKRHPTTASSSPSPDNSGVAPRTHRPHD
jgi:protein-S-isoprenylcysteine O-methyltransferase Ste14